MKNLFIVSALILTACFDESGTVVPIASDANVVPPDVGNEAQPTLDSACDEAILFDTAGDTALDTFDAPVDAGVDVGSDRADAPQEAFIFSCSPINGTYTQSSVLETTSCNSDDAGDEASILDANLDASAVVTTVSFTNDYPSIFAGCAVTYNKSTNGCNNLANITCDISNSQVSIEHDSVSIKDINTNSIIVTSIIALQDSVTLNTICTSIYQTTYSRQ